MTKNNNFSKEMISNIKNYENEIITLEDFVTIVRKKPGMYLGPLGDRGLIQMYREILQNSIDEMVKLKSPCNEIFIEFNENTYEFKIRDNGRGIPFNKMETMFTTQHTSSNYEKELGEYSSGTHGIGAKVVNALSEYFNVYSYILNKGKKLSLIDGKLNNINDIKKPEFSQGTVIEFQPKLDILGKLSITSLDIRYVTGVLFTITPKSDINRIHIKCINKDGTSSIESYENKDGVAKKIKDICKNPLLDNSIEFTYDTGEMKAIVVLNYDMGAKSSDNKILAFANMTPTSKGTHIDGFKDGFVKFLRKYINKVYLTPKSKTKIERDDILYTMRGVISAFHLDPILVGQDKDELSNVEMKKFVSDLITSSMEQWSIKNPKQINRLCKYIKDISVMRSKMLAESIKISTKYKTSVFSKGLPDRYVPPRKRKGDDLELYIVEGNSAGGSVKTNMENNQGLFPIKGKLPNCLAKSKTQFLNNTEISGIIRILGYNPATVLKDCDPKKCKFAKVIILTDADPDGAHIRNLIVLFFSMYLRPLLQAGILHFGTPPLYGHSKSYSNKNKGKFKYFIDKKDYQTYSANLFIKNNTITDNNNKKLSNDELIEIFNKNIDYVYYLLELRNNISVNPFLLESIILNIDKSYSIFKKVIEKEYRFIKVDNINNKIVIDGEFDKRRQFIVIDDRFISLSQNILNLIKNVNGNDIYYYFNNERISLFKLMMLLENSKPDSIERYKGLGEMNAKQLYESTLNVKHRTLVQYKSDNLDKDIEEIFRLDNNKKLISDKIQSINRYDL